MIRHFSRWLLSRPLLAGWLRERLLSWAARRQPQFIIGQDELKPVFLSYQLFSTGRWTWNLHVFHNPDSPGFFHSHPFVAYRFVLSGGYVEEWLHRLPQGRLPAHTARYSLHPGDYGRIDPEDTHRIDQTWGPTVLARREQLAQQLAGKAGGDLRPFPVFSLWIAGPETNHIETLQLTPEGYYQQDDHG